MSELATIEVKKTYGAREGAPFKKEHAQDIGEFINSLPLKTSENILGAIGANKNHVLYSYIEWNNKIAGHNYRLQQVRNIVNHVTIEIKEIGDELPVRAFYSITDEKDEDNHGRPVYIDLHTAFEDEYCRAKIISRAKSELNNWRERYHQYSELSKIINFLENI